MPKDAASTKATGGGGYTFADKVAAGHSQISPIDQFYVCIYQSHKNHLAVYKIKKRSDTGLNHVL